MITIYTNHKLSKTIVTFSTSATQFSKITLIVDTKMNCLSELDTLSTVSANEMQWLKKE